MNLLTHSPTLLPFPFALPLPSLPLTYMQLGSLGECCELPQHLAAELVQRSLVKKSTANQWYGITHWWLMEYCGRITFSRIEVENPHFSAHFISWVQTPSGGMPSNINVIYTLLKSTFSGLQFCCWQCGSVFICVAVIASHSVKSRKIPIKY